MPRDNAAPFVAGQQLDKQRERGGKGVGGGTADVIDSPVRSTLVTRSAGHRDASRTAPAPAARRDPVWVRASVPDCA